MKLEEILASKQEVLMHLSERAAVVDFIFDMMRDNRLTQTKGIELIEQAQKKYGQFKPKKPHGNSKHSKGI